jgi:hypothetical protein
LPGASSKKRSLRGMALTACSTDIRRQPPRWRWRRRHRGGHERRRHFANVDHTVEIGQCGVRFRESRP